MYYPRHNGILYSVRRPTQNIVNAKYIYMQTPIMLSIVEAENGRCIIDILISIQYGYLG